MTLLRRSQIASFDRTFWEASTHFIGSPDFPEMPFIQTATGAGAGVSAIAGEANAPGIIRLTTGSTSTGSMIMRTPSSFILNSQIWTLNCRFRLPQVPSVSNPFVAVIGFGEGLVAGTDQLTSGMYSYTDMDNYYTCTKQSGQTPFYSYITLSPVTNNWRSLTLQVRPASNDCLFTLDNESATLNAIPTNAMGVAIGVFKFNTTVATPGNLDIDYLRVRLE